MEKPTEAQLAQATLKLLERTELKGNEVAMFVEIHNWVQSKVDAPQYAPDEAFPDRD